MPVPRHDRLTFSGVFGPLNAPLEIWSWGLTFAYVDQLHMTTEVLAQRAREAYAEVIAPIMPPSTHLTRTRVSRHNAGGPVTRLGGGEYDQGDDLTPVTGTGLNTLYPLQTALAVSFSSNRPDASGKGRCFLPMPSVVIAADYRITEADANRVLSAMNTLQARVVHDTASEPDDAYYGGFGDHAVISSFGTSSPVTRYRVGRVPDTMRSRRNALPESYVEAPRLLNG